LDPDSAGKTSQFWQLVLASKFCSSKRKVSVAPVFIALVTPFELSTGVRDALM
jgi:hypothetical protein